MGVLCLATGAYSVGTFLNGPERTAWGVLVSRLRGMAGGRCRGPTNGVEERTGDMEGGGPAGAGRTR